MTTVDQKKTHDPWNREDDCYGDVWYVCVAGQLHSDDPCKWSEAQSLKRWYQTHHPNCPIILTRK